MCQQPAVICRARLPVPRSTVAIAPSVNSASTCEKGQGGGAIVAQRHPGLHTRIPDLRRRVATPQLPIAVVAPAPHIAPNNQRALDGKSGIASLRRQA